MADRISENLAMLMRVVAHLAPLRERLVFLGGALTVSIGTSKPDTHRHSKPTTADGGRLPEDSASLVRFSRESSVCSSRRGGARWFRPGFAGRHFGRLWGSLLGMTSDVEPLAAADRF